MDVDPVNLLSRWLHVGGAALLVGGLFFARYVFPAAGVAPEESTGSPLGTARKKWAAVVGLLTLVLLATGFWNYIAVTIPKHKGDGPYHALMGIKILLAFGVMFLAAAGTGRSPKLAGLRKPAVGTVTVLAAIIILMIAGYLKMRGVPVPAGV